MKLSAVTTLRPSWLGGNRMDDFHPISGSTRSYQEAIEDAVDEQLQKDVDEAAEQAYERLEREGHKLPRRQIHFTELFPKRRKT